MQLSIIISTYNEPEWLEKVIWGYEQQSFKDFELLIADDGSDERTKTVVEKYINKTFFPIKHIWHEDQGYQKCTILNKAIAKTSTDYILFSDGDCIPRRDFAQTHVGLAEKGYFLSGGAIRMSMSLSQLISKEDIIAQRCFDKNWLETNGLPKKFFKNLKLTQSPTLANILNKITPAKSTWNGGNASGWKSDIIAVNGFNEDLHYGGQDREFGERMFNLGLKSKQIRYSAVCVHLEHHRAYKTNDAIKKNKETRKAVIQKGLVKAANGIDKYLTNQ